MKLIATKALRYGGKEYCEGDAFEATDKHGKLLKAIKKAADADARSRSRSTGAAGRTGKMQFPEQQKPADAAPLTTESGLYARRDMRAQD